MQSIIFVYGLIADESKQLHSWLFKQIVETTSIHPTVIMMDSDLAVNAMVKKVFIKTYPIYYAFHITQNLHKNL